MKAGTYNECRSLLGHPGSHACRDGPRHDSVHDQGRRTHCLLGALTISSSGTVKAKAFHSDWTPSATLTAEFPIMGSAFRLTTAGHKPKIRQFGVNRPRTAFLCDRTESITGPVTTATVSTV
jgi:hypothetical protein